MWKTQSPAAHFEPTRDSRANPIGFGGERLGFAGVQMS